MRWPVVGTQPTIHCVDDSHILTMEIYTFYKIYPRPFHTSALIAKSQFHIIVQSPSLDTTLSHTASIQPSPPLSLPLQEKDPVVHPATSP